MPGIYTLLANDRPIAHWAVNVDVEESEFNAISPQKLDCVTWIENAVELSAQVRNMRYGQELWQLFVGAALVLLVIEMMICRLSTPAKEQQ